MTHPIDVYCFPFFIFVIECSCTNITINGYGPLCQKKYLNKPMCWIDYPSICKDSRRSNKANRHYSFDACKNGEII